MTAAALLVAGSLSATYAAPAAHASVVKTAAPDTLWEPPAWKPPKVTQNDPPSEPWRPHTGGRFGVPKSDAPPAAKGGGQPDSELNDAQPAQPNVAPLGTAVGVPGIGEMPSFQFQQFSLATDQAAEVNIANGNLLVKANDSTIAVPGYGLRDDRFYNGLSVDNGSMGGGWMSNNNAWDVGLDNHGTYADFHGPNGIVLRFPRTGPVYGHYDSPAGSNMTLQRTADYGTYVFILTFNKSGDKWEFDDTGSLTATYDRNNVGEHYTYSMGKIVTVSSAATMSGPYYNLNWNSSTGQLDSIQDSAGRTTSYTYDTSYRLQSATTGNPDHKTTSYSYDSSGRLSTITLPSAASAAGTTVVTFGYDTSSRVTSVTQKNLSPTWGAGTDIVMTFAYSAGQTIVTDANNHTSTYTIDGNGRVTSTKDALNRARSITWTSNGDIQMTTDALGTGSSHTTTYTYDGSNNATNAQLPTGAAATATYATGTGCTGTTGTPFEPKCSTDATGNSATYQYDANGNLTQQNDTTSGAAVAEFTRTYNGATPSCGGFVGQACTSTDGNAKTTTYAYDTNGNLTTVTPPAPAGATTYTYDALNRVHTVKDGNGQTTTYGYDVRDRVVLTTYPNSQTLTTTYYPGGLTQSASDSAGGSTSWEYDVQGRITKQAGPAASIAEKYTYDKVGNLLTAADGSATAKYGYDIANQLTTITDPGGTCPGSGNPAAGSGCTKLTYDNNAAEASRTYPGGSTVTTTRDNAGRATRITAKDSGGVVRADIGYSFAAPGSGADRDTIQARISYLEQGITAGATTSYAYDSRSRLINATERVGTTVTASWAYGYDGAGNRTTQTRAGSTGATAGTVTSAYNAANRIASTTADTTTWAFDADNQQTKNGITAATLTYGDRMQASKVGSTTEGYFGGGNSVRVTSGANTFTTSPLGVVSVNSSSASKSYTRTPHGSLVDFRSTYTDYYVSDTTGSVIGLFTSSGAWDGGYSYSPYGETRAAATTTAATANLLRYAGARNESGSIYKMGARYYDASLGRFTQMDPTGQEAAPFAYAKDDPINNSDPSGTTAVSLILKIIALAIDYGSLWAALEDQDDAEVIGAFTGIGFDVACSVATAEAAAATLGAGLAFAGICIAISLYAENLAENAAEESE